jgi:dGTP triphosphohydrolase
MAKLPKSMPSKKKDDLMPEELDPIFGEEMNLADDVEEGGDDLESALDAEKLGPADDLGMEDSELTPEEEALIEDFKQLLKKRPEALEKVQEEDLLEEDVEEDDKPAEMPENILGGY